MAGPAGSNGARKRRRGRGMPSSIDRLPDDCEEDIVWVKRELNGRQRTQTEILDEFNSRLASKGHNPISKGAFSRYSINAAALRRENELVQRPFLDLVYELFPEGVGGDAAIAAREALKVRFAMLSADQDTDPKQLASLSLALTRINRVIIDTKADKREDEAEERNAEERNRKAERDAEEAARAKVAETADTAAKIASEAGLSAERVAAIRKGVLGLAG